MLSWATFDQIAAHKHDDGKIGGFAGLLPRASACDFDEVKRDCCRMRASSLTSVDAVTVGTDGRIYFVEFKDTEDFPLGSLRRKAFDSLVLFWMSLGETFSFDEVCQRSVFAYVRPDGAEGDSVADDAPISIVFEDDDAMKPPVDAYGAPIENRLNELKELSLYNDVWTISAAEFSHRYRASVGVIDKTEFRKRIGYRRPTSARPVWRTRLQVSECGVNCSLMAARGRNRSDCIRFCQDDKTGVDFRSLVDQMNEFRCPLSAGGHLESKRMSACDVCVKEEPRLLFYHDWTAGNFNYTRLINTVFDGFLLWCVIFGEAKNFDQLMSKISLLCIYEGRAPELPDESKIQEWQKAFWTDYRGWCMRKGVDCDGRSVMFGLNWFVDQKMYGDIKTLPMEDCVLEVRR